MNTITYLRQFRIGGIAIFDLIASYIGIYFLTPFLSKIAKKLGLDIGRKEWLWLTIPIGVIIHLLARQQTALNEMLLNSGNYPLKIVLIFMIYIGLRGIRRIK
jgi:hypothetical protein